MQDESGFPRSILNSSARILITTISLLIPCFTCAEQLSIRGSDTLIYLGQQFAVMYSLTSPQTHFDIQGGGPARALNALSARRADVAQSEGTMPVRSSDLVSVPIGVQAIVVYVNASNPIRELTVAQLRSIFRGEITNWKMLGGPDLNILLYAGESTTGTLTYFQDSVLQGKEPYPFEGKANTKALLEEIASHRGAIGYGSPATRAGTRPLDIKSGPASAAIPPTGNAIRSRKYPLTRSISWTVHRQRGPMVDAFCHWALSSAGQIVVEAVGFEPLLPEDRRIALRKLDISD